MGRTIIFGDIHGCYQEWEDLLDLLSVSSSDRLVAAGDLVCKGPSTVRALDLARRMKNCRCVMGNHDYYLLKNWQAGCLEELTGPHQQAVEEMGNRIRDYMEFIQSWPYFLDLEECLVVHAGLRPGTPLHRQELHDLLHLRTVEPGNRPWFEDYTGEKPVVFGHWARRGLVNRPNAIGLDTGCVYGGRLSACIFPGRKIVSVPARQNYSEIG